MTTAEATGALSRLSQQVDSKAEEARDKGRRMLEHRAQYAGVRARLQTLGDTLRHRVMVPVTSKAFLPATLVHTNEVVPFKREAPDVAVMSLDIIFDHLHYITAPKQMLL